MRWISVAIYDNMSLIISVGIVYLRYIEHLIKAKKGCVPHYMASLRPNDLISYIRFIDIVITYWPYLRLFYSCPIEIYGGKPHNRGGASLGICERHKSIDRNRHAITVYSQRICTWHNVAIRRIAVQQVLVGQISEYLPYDNTMLKALDRYTIMHHSRATYGVRLTIKPWYGKHMAQVVLLNPCRRYANTVPVLYMLFLKISHHYLLLDNYDTLE